MTELLLKHISAYEKAFGEKPILYLRKDAYNSLLKECRFLAIFNQRIPLYGCDWKIVKKTTAACGLDLYRMSDGKAIDK